MRKKTLISILFALAAATGPNGARADMSIQVFDTYLELPKTCVLPARRSLVDQIVFVCDLDSPIASMSVYVEQPEKCASNLERSSKEIVLRKVVEARSQVIWRSKGERPFDHWFVWDKDVCVHAISSEVRYLQTFFGAVWQ